MKQSLFSKCCAVALGLGLVLSLASPVAAQETKKKKSPSDRTVRVIMGWAFAGIPETLPGPTGKIFKIDRSDPKKFMIPLEDARRIIKQATISARADLCGLEDIQRRHFESIMRYERSKMSTKSDRKGKRKWTSSQMTYIDILIAATSNIMTGTSTAGDDTKKKDDGSQDIRNTYKCSADERERAKADVEADIRRLAQLKK